MNFMIFDESGNAIDAFSDLGDAQRSLARMVREDPSLVRRLALLTFDDDGNAIGEAEVAADLADTADFACSITISAPLSWIQTGARTFASRWLDSPTAQLQMLNGGAAPPPTVA